MTSPSQAHRQAHPQAQSHPWPSWLSATPTTVYKDDHRSKVWRVDPPASAMPVVIKRFEYNPVRQRLAHLLGLHPAEREIANVRRLTQAGFAVVPILDRHVQVHGLKLHYHLATRHMGLTLLTATRQSRLPEDPQIIEALLVAVGAIPAMLLEAGWVFRDLKTSNIVLDDQYKPWLIDVGSARKHQPTRCGQGGNAAWRMLRVLDQSMAADRWSVEDRRACLSRALACLCPEPVNHAYDKLARIVLK